VGGVGPAGRCRAKTRSPPQTPGRGYEIRYRDLNLSLNVACTSAGAFTMIDMLG
jgi:hypothetical protein